MLAKTFPMVDLSYCADFSFPIRLDDLLNSIWYTSGDDVPLQAKDSMVEGLLQDAAASSGTLPPPGSPSFPRRKAPRLSKKEQRKINLDIESRLQKLHQGGQRKNCDVVWCAHLILYFAGGVNMQAGSEDTISSFFTSLKCERTRLDRIKSVIHFCLYYSTICSVAWSLQRGKSTRTVDSTRPRARYQEPSSPPPILLKRLIQ
jgi:hypothetical protein